MIQERQCGTCTACCFVLAVHEVKKPACTKCQHEIVGGCGIYKTKPDPCSGYICHWLLDGSPELIKLIDPTLDRYKPITDAETERPDKCGLILELAQTEKAGRQSVFGEAKKEGGVNALIAREVWPGASDQYWGKKLLKRLSKSFVIIIVYQNEKRKMIGPPSQIRLIANVIERRLPGALDRS